MLGDFIFGNAMSCDEWKIITVASSQGVEFIEYFMQLISTNRFGNIANNARFINLIAVSSLSD